MSSRSKTLPVLHRDLYRQFEDLANDLGLGLVDHPAHVQPLRPGLGVDALVLIGVAEHAAPRDLPRLRLEPERLMRALPAWSRSTSAA
jgi:hypothetical protein